MGGRGGSYSRSTDIAVFATGADGTNIDLSESPLHYGGSDPNLTGKVRATIEDFEDKRWKNKIEYSRFVDANGNVIEDNRGGKGSVRASLTARMSAVAMSHNHPRSGSEADLLGGTFSTGDLNNFVRFNQTTYRATASEGTYSISKLKGFDSRGFKSYYTAECTMNYGAYSSTITKLNASYRSGSMEYKEYISQAHKAFNKFLVAEHNSLRAGQKLYGYHYTLERRAK
jgi:hypothetical protein